MVSESRSGCVGPGCIPALLFATSNKLPFALTKLSRASDHEIKHPDQGQGAGPIGGGRKGPPEK